MTQKKLGRYEIIGELGKGAMGLVYLGRDPLIGRKLALKTFRVGFSAQDKELEQFHARFLREAQSAGILSHPNIVTIHDVAVDPDGDFFIAMEYVQGTDLKHLMQRRRLELPFVIQTVAQIADGLDYAHSQGVVHRDIKPANIIITKEQQAKITDFGIARVDASNLTTEGQLLGTPNYMAPEQIQARPVDHRTDLFSLGVMLFELVTGKKPFAGESLTQVTHRIVNEPHPRPDQLVPGLPSGIVQAIDRALEKDPLARYDRGADMARDLRMILAPKSSSGTGSFLGDEPPTGAVPIQNPALNMTMTSADAHAALKPSGGTLAGTVAAEASGTIRPAAQPEAPGRPNPPTGPQPIMTPESEVAKPNRALVVVAVLAVLAVMGAIGASLVGNRSDPAPQVTELDPEEELRRKVDPLVREARRLLSEDGNAATAHAELEKALAITPEDRALRQLTRFAEDLAGQDPADVQLAYLLSEAKKSLDERLYPEAIRDARAALEVVPDQPEALAILEQAQERQESRNKVRDRFRNETPPPPAGSSSSSVPTPQTAEVPEEATAQATLAIEIESEVAAGRITVFAGTDTVLQESFEFPRRRSGIKGRLSGSHTLPSGAIRFGIFAKAKEASQTRTVELDADLRPDQESTLKIRILSDGRVAAKIE